MIMKKKNSLYENLNLAKAEPAATAEDANKLGLSHVGFGRYHDPKTNQVTHIAQNDRLVPIKKAVKTNTYRQTSTDDFANLADVLAPEVEQTHSTLTATYTPEKYDDAELDALYTFTESAYDAINEKLATLPLDITAKDIAPNSPDDTLPSLISALDSIMKKSRTPQEFIVYADLGDSIDLSVLEAGRAFRFKGFRSTTLNMNNLFLEGVTKLNILQIKVKKNARGIYVADFSPTPEDQEFILPRGARIEVVTRSSKLIGSSEQGYIEINYVDCTTKG